MPPFRGAASVPPRPDRALPFEARAKAAYAYGRTLVGPGREVPEGSNRGLLPDYLAREFGSPLGSRWCALLAGHLRAWAGAWSPRRWLVGSCDAWRAEAEAAGRWVSAGTLRGGPVTLDAAPLLSVVLYTWWRKLLDGPYAGQFDAIHVAVLLGRPALGRPRENLEDNTSAAQFSATAARWR